MLWYVTELAKSIGIGIGIGFLSCIGIGIVKTIFEVLVLVLVLLKEDFPSIGIGIALCVYFGWIFSSFCSLKQIGRAELWPFKGLEA